MNSIPLNRIKLGTGFWLNRVDLLSDEIIPYQWETLNNRTPGVPLSHAVENFKIAAGESEGEPGGTIFQDSDVAKWIEAASYSLLNRANPELEAHIDELIRLVEKSQHDNGYVNTFFTAKGIEQRWTDLVMGHEMYCAGHLIEAAVAYYRATGKRVLLDVMCRYADLIDREFGPEEGKLHSYDGHPEIELALYRLAGATEKDKYRKLADYFINIRGSVPHFYMGDAAKEGMIPKSRWFESDYYLAHIPVREMEEITGHAVRAVYLFAAMADQYGMTGEPELWQALRNLWDSLEKGKVYITGGIGSQAHGERFTVPYDLPPGTGYTETCASIGLIFWAWRMLLSDPDSRYADMIERALYNGALSGISLDGKSYFYVNPLEVIPDTAGYRHDHDHVQPHREGWNDCACCPTNIARLIGSVGEYLYSSSEEALYIHQFASSTTEIMMKGVPLAISQETNYPWEGELSLAIDPEEKREFSVYLRKPVWCDAAELEINGIPQREVPMEKGYYVLRKQWEKGDRVRMRLKMEVRYNRANSKIHDLAGRIALSYGPLVYCFEEIDNGAGLHRILLDPERPVEIVSGDMEPSPSLNILLTGYKEKEEREELYYPLLPDSEYKEVPLRAVPYFQWGNRKRDGEMRLWMRRA